MSDQITRLKEIMARLRAPEGCPWDREQTTHSLRPYVIEEAHEVAEAIDRGEPGGLRDELGDLLLQVVFHAQIASERSEFDLEDVARAISDKLERRHPHVFGDVEVSGVDEVWRNWDAIKAEEKREAGEAPRSRLEGIPKGLPALIHARQASDKAARAGFDWPHTRAVLEKVREELDELEELLDANDEAAAARRDEELGDLLFAMASLARHLELDPEGALARANAKFAERFHRIEELARERGGGLEELDAATLDTLWRRVKSEE